MPCDKKKNILFLITSLSGGGAERVTVNLANAFAERHNVTICCFKKASGGYPVESAVTVIEIPELKPHSVSRYFYLFVNGVRYAADRFIPRFTVYPYTNAYSARFVKKLKAKLRTDVTISMLAEPNAVNARLAGGLRIMSERNDPRKKRRAKFERAIKCFRKADRIVFQSSEVMSLFPEEIRNAGVVIRNPVRIDAIEYRTDSKMLVSVGRLHPQKNQEVLIRAFAEFHREYPDYVLYIWGEGRERQKLETLIGELKLEGSVYLPGFAQDIRKQTADAKMFILSSDYEGLPNALMEAMMMGLPVISTACNGSRELIRNEENGLLVPVGDKKALSEAMKRLASDEALCMKLSGNAKRSADSFKTEIIAGEWERLFD